jgi:DMSO/TMAO reductase YedYZ molybdopterin-dependent catalytic subunit
MQRTRYDASAARAAVTLPAAKDVVPVAATSYDLGKSGIPFIVPARDFYRIDTALSVPQLDPRQWKLRIHGMVARELTLSYDQLLARPLIERAITLTCVSNEVGGTLAGSARWLGVPLGAFLRENGVRAGSSQLVCRSVDGMTIGAPTRAALDVGDAMLAIGMNGQPLPVEHGFPVRMVIPGLYGYVSACKWLTHIEATTFRAFDAYWVQRLWAQQGTIKIESRIDTPASGRTFPAGRRAVAGVAWAQTRGISRVEVRIDNGGWTAAQLSPEVGLDLWRQWVLPVDFRPGDHRISVRATSGDGELQTAAVVGPFPAGASGWHTIPVKVR